MRWLFVAGLSAHAVGAALLWWFMPSGFDPFSRPFWQHEVLIPLVALVSIVTTVLVAMRRRSGHVGVYLLLGFWTTLAFHQVAANFPTPIDLLGLIFGGAMIVMVLGVLFYEVSVDGIRARDRISGLIGGLVLALLLTMSIYPEAAQTRPAPRPVSLLGHGIVGATSAAEAMRPRDAGVNLSPLDASWTIATPDGELSIQPCISFEATSKNGFLALGRNRDNAGPEVVSVDSSGGDVTCRWADREAFGNMVLARGTTRTSVVRTDLGRSVRIASEHVVPRTIYAHVASFCRIRWNGSSPIRLRIGGDSVGAVITPTRSEYPTGAPAVFLVASESGMRLLRATSAEKGPFTTLGQMPLGDPWISVLHGDRAVCAFRVGGFADQCSFQQSPTAGWSLPVNRVHIEAAEENAAGKPVSTWLDYSLGDTSIGRGFDAVGTAAGTYWSLIEVLVPPSPYASAWR